MLPPAFCALTGIANATLNPATRNIRASALERIAAFIDISSRCVARPVFRIANGLPARLSGNAVAGKAVHTPRVKSRRLLMFRYADRASGARSFLRLAGEGCDLILRQAGLLQIGTRVLAERRHARRRRH